MASSKKEVEPHIDDFNFQYSLIAVNIGLAFSGIAFEIFYIVSSSIHTLAIQSIKWSQ